MSTRWHSYETWRRNWGLISSHFWSRLCGLIFWWLIWWWFYMKCFRPGHSGSSIFCLFSSMTSFLLRSFILKNIFYFLWDAFELTWNQIFTWFCVMFRVIAISALSAIERYFFSLNFICNWFIWYSLRKVFNVLIRWRSLGTQYNSQSETRMWKPS